MCEIEKIAKNGQRHWKERPKNPHAEILPPSIEFSMSYVVFTLFTKCGLTSVTVLQKESK